MEIDEDGRQSESLVLGEHGLGGGGGHAARVERGAELPVAEAGAELQEVVVLGPSLPQPGTWVGSPADDLRGIGEGPAQVGDHLGSAFAHIGAEAGELLGVRAARATGGFARLAATLVPVADHEHGGEEAEEGKEEIV